MFKYFCEPVTRTDVIEIKMRENRNGEEMDCCEKGEKKKKTGSGKVYKNEIKSESVPRRATRRGNEPREKRIASESTHAQIHVHTASREKV